MENSRNEALSRIKAVHADLEMISEASGLTIDERNELITAKVAIDTLIDSLSYPQEMRGPITESSFPAIGHFRNEDLDALTIRGETK
ncbi:hypothetical protein NQF87_00065 [Bombella sp. TMW 2.2559]|uniref:Uncharacterized protein n=1 Tax=Bombella dulcis TaxID=2967339 RepID=A0ABT3WAK3_9PROT|nr:hypothetical protein [Bombella dulcis]MCX5615379.1 hypothetical protein [Bombella dulcis]